MSGTVVEGDPGRTAWAGLRALLAVLLVFPLPVFAAVTVTANGSNPATVTVGEPVVFEAVLTNCRNGLSYRFWWEIDGPQPDSTPAQNTADPCAIDPAPSLQYTFSAPGLYEVSFVYERWFFFWLGGERGSVQVEVLAAGATLPGRFNAVEPGTDPLSGPIRTQVAGDAISLDIAALDQTGSGLLNNYNGVVDVYLVDASDNSGAFEAGTNCRDSWAVVGVLGTADFQNAANPQTISFPAHPDALREARVRLEGTRGRGGGQIDIACSADAFAVRPARFEVSATDADRASAGTARSLSAATADASPVHHAGRPFTISAQAVNSAGNPTPGYGGTPVATAAAPVLGATLGTLAAGLWSTNAGLARTDEARYSEVGAFRLEVYDDAFAAVDAADTPLATRRVGPVPIDVGRFVPDDFQVAWNVPSFRAGCTGATASFTYAGAPIAFVTAPVATVTALNADGGVTANFTGPLFKLEQATLTNKQYTAAGAETVDTAGLPALDPVIADHGDGTGSLGFGDGTGLRIERGAPRAPFDAEIALSIDIGDTDGVVFSGNPARIGDASPGNGMDFVDLNGLPAKQIRFGRASIEHAFGSEHMALAMAARAEYYAGAGAGFVPNTDDTCTSLGLATNLWLNNPATAGGTWQPGDSTMNVGAGISAAMLANVPMVSGDAGLSFSAPGDTGHIGVRLALDGLVWLRFDWNGDGSHDNDPPAVRATFGSYRGDDRIVYWRERFD